MEMTDAVDDDDEADDEAPSFLVKLVKVCLSASSALMAPISVPEPKLHTMIC
uniref:IP14439p n=1 Tax=Drosophila melanogaster TaxID=7227 RepID=Q1EBY9_DROME|nr:IP14439p [Drosophila melanogaster]